MKKRHLFSMMCLLGIALSLQGQPARKAIKENIFRSGSNYYAYPGPSQPQLTPTPDGYRPFYISHYGRHGSRHLIGDSDFDKAYTILGRADSLGKLTPLGKDVLRRVTTIRKEAHLRHGELTPLGAIQHRGIAHRMVERFPEVFGEGCEIDAKSTVVIRCILSMENALQEISRLRPSVKITHDASEHDMWYLNFNDTVLGKLKMEGEAKQKYDAFCDRHKHNDRLMRSLFNDDNYWQNEVNPQTLAYHLFKLASNLQSTELRHTMSLYDLFTEDETYDQWLMTNAWWYIAYGPSPLNGSVQPYSQRNLLRKIIEEADSSLVLPHPSATLRYGHEVCVLPLVCLMEMNHYGEQIEDLEQLDKRGWNCYEIFPMGSNVQLIFYRPISGHGDILLKVLLNENEVTLPLDRNGGPYYKWRDVKNYYLKKLNNYSERQ